MRRSVLLVLLLAALLLGGLFAWLQRGAEVTQQAERQLLLPALSGRLGEVRALSIRHGELPAVRIERAAAGDGWIVPAKAGYPAAAGEVNHLLRALAEARKVEAKTRNPDNHARLGLAAKGEGRATRLRIDGLGSAPLVLLIGQGSRQGGQLVRLAGDDQVWLVDQPLELVDNELAWLDRRISAIPFASVREVEVRHADGERLNVWRDSPAQADLQLRQLPVGRRLAYQPLANGMALLFAALDFADAAPLAQVGFKDRPELEFSLSTFDGGVLRGAFHLQGGQHWLVLGESEGLEDRLIAGRDWAYRLEEQQYRMLARRLKDLLGPAD
ncbi:protein of unknown function [Pseudomonas linyingensis]|uniref:DUF4340 domain-containing protein n=1 Tax=Pseudomonas linyingensis TaxID=915471 RepID=A0A1H7CMB0_9PSED|nr:DUF4340 domain-containing protein [Pseudomonas linyingensis]SEJ90741.1 protein of unknown function [Pseudomonas linyingensis]